MGRKYSQTSDISGRELSDGEDSYQVSFSRTVERGKSFQKCDGFIITHEEFMDLMKKQNFQPQWKKIVKQTDGKWLEQDHG